MNVYIWEYISEHVTADMVENDVLVGENCEQPS